MNFGHGGNVAEIVRKYNLKEEDIIDFSANINPLGISEKVKNEMILALDKIERYPDITYFELKNSISKYEDIEPSKIILGNGAAEVIFNIVRALKPKKVLLPAPTFSEYEDAVNSINGKVEHYILKDDFKLDLGFIDAMEDDIDMVFICNPNNPTGVLTDKDYLKNLLDKAVLNNIIVVLDESFIDFIKDKKLYSTIDLIDEYNNLVLVKSLTKFFAFPGIRLGYLLCSNEKIIEKVNSVSVPWSINTVAAKGGAVALGEKEYIDETLNYVEEERNFLYSGLKNIDGLNIFTPSVNFIFFKTYREIDLKDKLLKENILIRSCNNYKGLNHTYYRVAVRKREENKKLLEALRKIIYLEGN